MLQSASVCPVLFPLVWRNGSSRRGFDHETHRRSLAHETKEPNLHDASRRSRTAQITANEHRLEPTKPNCSNNQEMTSASSTAPALVFPKTSGKQRFWAVRMLERCSDEPLVRLGLAQIKWKMQNQHFYFPNDHVTAVILVEWRITVKLSHTPDWLAHNTSFCKS